MASDQHQQLRAPDTHLSTTHQNNHCALETSEPVIGMPIDRASLILPADLIQGGETIILLLKPSLWFIILACLRTFINLIVLTALACFFIPQLPWQPITQHDVIFIALILASARLLWQILEWFGRIYVLTDRRVIRIRGVLRIQHFETKLQNLQHTDLLFSIRERLFTLGTIAFSTAGSATAEAYWVMINNPLSVHRKVIETINRAK